MDDKEKENIEKDIVKSDVHLMKIYLSSRNLKVLEEGKLLFL